MGPDFQYFLGIFAIKLISKAFHWQFCHFIINICEIASANQLGFFANVTVFFFLQLILGQCFSYSVPDFLLPLYTSYTCKLIYFKFTSESRTSPCIRSSNDSKCRRERERDIYREKLLVAIFCEPSHSTHVIAGLKALDASIFYLHFKSENQTNMNQTNMFDHCSCIHSIILFKYWSRMADIRKHKSVVHISIMYHDIIPRKTDTIMTKMSCSNSEKF